AGAGTRSQAWPAAHRSWRACAAALRVPPATPGRWSAKPRVSLGVPADTCGLRPPPELAVPGVFHSLLLIPRSDSLPENGPKSAKPTAILITDQWLTRRRITRLVARAPRPGELLRLNPHWG